MTRIPALVFAGACIGLLLAGCAGRDASVAAPAPFRGEGAPLIDPARGAHDAGSIAAARGANDFAFRLGAALLQDAGHENFVVSPYSVWLPLAALLNATREQYRPELLRALGAQGLGAGDVNRAASRMLFDLTNERGRRQGWDGAFRENPLRIANAVFVDHGFPLRAQFAQVFMDFYRGESMSVDFRDPDTVAAVNRWASDNTNGRINRVVQEFDPDTVAAIANAIYFSDSWRDGFCASQTERGAFYAHDGESHAYFMRLERNDFSYFEDAHVQAVNLPFATGGGMKIILPRDGDAAGFLSAMTAEKFEGMQRDSVLASGRLLLPRFSIENTIDSLKPALVALGVPLFDEQAAPLTGGLVYDGGLRVWLSQAVQVAMIEVDEEGATAAAVTVLVAVAEAALEPVTTFEMICDRPFAFVLHRQTNDGGRQVLFTGVVNRP